MSLFCLNATEESRNYRFIQKFETSLTFDSNLGETTTFETERSLRIKICSSKRNHVALPYGIAAYDVDFDAPPQPCNSLTIRSRYARLRLLAALDNITRSSYAPVLDRETCESFPVKASLRSL
ncbi:hypothetical protein HPB50_006796 [Hyalomma asiaticum]|uniref:Uncharacterized protein n=1 Tax=Hyalomma asiaticum TaxID=266040 RepID=A0ACB7SR07_HYAAI|nr:hypothetical protein HPB50_006796 [Hyalomma asiaticum]